MRRAIANAVLAVGLVASGGLAAVAVWSLWTFEPPRNVGAVSSGILIFLIIFGAVAFSTHLVFIRLARRHVVGPAVVRRHASAVGVQLAIVIGVHLWSVRVWERLSSADLATFATMTEATLRWAWQTLEISNAVKALAWAVQIAILSFAVSTAVRGEPQGAR